ncbi:MAG: DegT/DnrJ/EryC1/StrS family aminotransferase, partial [Burkholderiaceae bacterium]|nr:DegT/DnrJ/EryC1/StrS family aminotransferase [Burkholderiaceae bacterium]
DWDARVRSLRHHGMSVASHLRHAADQVIFERYDEHGYNFRLTDLQAAIGRVQLGRLGSMVARRRALAARYGAALGAHPGLRVPIEPAWARSNWQSYGVVLGDGLEQRGVMQAMLERGVSTRRGVMCAHREPAWRDRAAWRCLGDPEIALARSEHAQDRTVLLPLSPQMSEQEQDRVIEVLCECLR